jgi:glyoxylase-like metal-dependent hydrolase (beta-lactamase superfamily II)
VFRCEEIVPGVWRFLMARSLLGKDLYPTACYMVPQARLMIDSGSALFAGRTLGEARAAGVRTLILTHSHEDHTGGATSLMSDLGASCFAHPDAIPVLADPRSLRMLLYRRFMFGVPRKCVARPAADSIEDGGMRFRVIRTPGHSPDHLVVFEEERGWLFAGDAYIPVPNRVFFDTGCVYSVWVETLRALAGLGADRMFTGMGPVNRRPSRALIEKANRLSEISEKVMRLRGEGLKETEIAKRLFPGDLKVRLVTGGNYSAVNIVRACLRSPVSGSSPDGRFLASPSS